MDFRNISKAVLLFQCFSISFCYLIDGNPYRHAETLDQEGGKYHLEWLIDWAGERVVFTTTVETKGWVGFGLSKNGTMDGADIVIGGVSADGRTYFSDRHGVGKHYPVQDTIQNWLLEKAWETETHTSLTFSRKFETCDDHDIPINDDTLALIWAYGDTDNRVGHLNRGSFNVYLRDPDLTPRYVEQKKRSSLHLKEMGNVTIFTMQNKLILPEKRTTYWCNLHKISLPKKHHTIGYALQIDSPEYSKPHHILIFKCTVPPNLNVEQIFEPFLSHPGEECYSPGTERTQLPTQFCTDLRYGISIGGRSTFLPDHVGIPIGESENEYYLFQAHYDNPLNLPGIIAHTKVNVFITPEVRKFDAGVFSIGYHIPGSPSLILPPDSRDHVIYGHCSSECTQKMFPDGGMKVVALLLHSHNQGRKLKIQHFRNGKELPWISKDDNFNFDFQPGRNLRKEATILPGDQVTMKCIYDTTNRNSTTVGGYGTDQEMCKTFLTYYPKMNDYGLCRSMIVSPKFTKRYLGINNFTWDRSQIEYIVNSPSELEALTISKVSDTVIDWNDELRAQLRLDHITRPQAVICPISTASPSREAVAKEMVNMSPDFATLPTQAIPYQPKTQC